MRFHVLSPSSPTLTDPSPRPVFADSIKVVPNHGMPQHRHHTPGDLIININVQFPDTLPAESVPLLEQALPARPSSIPQKLPKASHVEDVYLTDMDETKRRFVESDQMDEDDENGGPQSVQCNQ